MDTVDRLIEPIQNYINSISPIKYDKNLSIICHSYNGLIYNVFFNTTNEDITSISYSSYSNKELLNKKIPYINKTHRWYNPKYVHVNCTISENFIRLIVSKVTGVRHKKLDISGLTINSENEYFKTYYKLITSGSDFKNIDITNFDLFTEMRISNKNGFCVFQDYITNLYIKENVNLTNKHYINLTKEPISDYKDILPLNTNYNYEDEPDSELTISLLSAYRKYYTMKNFKPNNNYHKFVSDLYQKNPGSYGSEMQKYVIKMLNVKGVKAGENRGDFLDNMGKYYELKVSYTGKNSKWSILHIRNYQQYDYMVIVLIDVLNNCNYNFFVIDKKLFYKEEKVFKKLGFQNGTKATNAKNSNIELRLTVGKEEVKILLKNNLLKDTSLESFLSYFKNKNLTQPDN